MGNCSSELRHYIRINDVDGVRRVLEEAGDGAPDLINDDITSDCILDSYQKNAPTRNYVQTALHLAARQNNLAAAKMLVKYGAHVHARDCYKRLAIHNAASSPTARTKDSIDVLRYLTEVGKAKDVVAKDARGNVPLHYAVKVQHLRAVEF